MEEKEFSEFWKIRNEELAIVEQQEREEERLRQAELKRYQKIQTDAKAKIVENDYRKELEAAHKAIALNDQHEKNFYSYAEKCLKEWQDSGKNVKPLVLELKGYKKRTTFGA